MAKKVLIISTSLRGGSNSDILAKECAKGAKEAGHDVELLSLKGKDIKYCIGCLSCQRTGRCVLKDDVADIMAKVKDGTLQKLGLGHFDSWASSFGETQTAIELAPEGTGYRAKTRFAKFFNLAGADCTF